ncbi:gem-associated protein 7 [Apus apus]|uniref:gem-associated protein 7 n=1 Tax=Apus apus TaxID=8895 RepID=UPI0021F8CBD9|nr:gem-associated protein 7 [Apus apus]
MPTPTPLPVGILRLPWGPDGSARGFDPDSPRFQAHRGSSRRDQETRARLRERFLRALGVARDRPARFCLREGIRVEAVFGTADVELAALQVEGLETPLGVQETALLREQDLLSFSFLLN